MYRGGQERDGEEEEEEKRMERKKKRWVLCGEMRSDALRVMDGEMGTRDWDDGGDEVMIRRETMER